MAQRTASTTLGEFDQNAVAGALHHAAAMVLIAGSSSSALSARSRAQRAFLVRAGQPRIARDIRRQDRR